MNQSEGDVLAPWTPGTMDIHHINTGRGDAAFMIFPDGTTLIFDAGAQDPTAPRTNSPRNAQAKPSADRAPGETHTLTGSLQKRRLTAQVIVALVIVDRF